MRGPRSGRILPRLDRSDPRCSPYVSFVVVELEVDLRPEHLQIGYQCVSFGNASRIAVEIARIRLRVTLDELDGIGIVIGGLCDDISRGPRNHLWRVRNAEYCLHLEILGNVRKIEIGLREP